mmetsp:Transcript_81136/g.135755  ORF Transcript_81136/g.135755 Transcript_81136/m.135755 type:complete len:251 (-) Transcript_81136:36-788(-)
MPLRCGRVGLCPPKKQKRRCTKHLHFRQSTGRPRPAAGRRPTGDGPPTENHPLTGKRRRCTIHRPSTLPHKSLRPSSMRHNASNTVFLGAAESSTRPCVGGSIPTPNCDWAAVHQKLARETSPNRTGTQTSLPFNGCYRRVQWPVPFACRQTRQLPCQPPTSPQPPGTVLGVGTQKAKRALPIPRARSLITSEMLTRSPGPTPHPLHPRIPKRNRGTLRRCNPVCRSTRVRGLNPMPLPVWALSSSKTDI